MRHILVLQSDGGYRCDVCGAIFMIGARLDDIQARPCRGAMETFFTLTDALDRPLPMPPAGPYLSYPTTPRNETDRKGDALIADWEKGRG